MSDESYLGEWIIGDVFPFPFWSLTERRYNTTDKRVELYEPDLETEYDWIKFYAKRNDNNCDVNDTTLFDITGVELILDGENICHYEWAQNDNSKVGIWYARLRFKRTSDGKEFFGKKIYKYNVLHTMPGSFGSVGS
jgi:hypothetical protein